MTPPVLKNVSKEEREKDGFKSFKDWMKKEDHIYIGPYVQKYMKSTYAKPSLWINPYYGHFKEEEAKEVFEGYLRANKHLMQRLPELEGKILEDWTMDNSHGYVLIKLYNEYVASMPEE